MKILFYILIAIGLGLVIYNTTLLNFSALTEGDSGVALISMLAAASAMLLVLILMVSLRIAKRKRS